MTRELPDLSLLVFHAKLDFLTVYTPRKLELPELEGSCYWPREHHGKRLTIHDPSPEDVRALCGALGAPMLAEIEVAVDVNCVPSVAASSRDEVLKMVIVNIFAWGLDPDGNGLIGPLRGYFCPELRKVQPFNHRLPQPSHQLLYGHRTDPVQVKAYYKKTDCRRRLSPVAWRARVEVALRREGLLAHGLSTLADLQVFRFRKELSGYFRHVKAATMRVLDRRNTSASQLHRLIAERLQQCQVHPEFQRAGMGSATGQGKLAGKRLRKHRNLEVNNRIGQALMRLERSFRREIRADLKQA